MEKIVKSGRGKWYVVRRTIKVLIIFLTTYHVSRTTAIASSSQLKEGNRQFKNGHYDKALKLYEDALIDTPYSSILQFNAGDATAMMGEFPKAEVSYMEAAKAANPLLRGASHYNRGDVLFYQGKYTEAADAYKDSLRANPADEDAKYNLGIALRAQKNPPKSARPPVNPSVGQDQKKEPGTQKKDGQTDKREDGQTKPGQMSKEDAERLLAAASAGEKKMANQRSARSEVPHPDEDW